MEWIIRRKTDGMYLATDLLYVQTAGFAHRFSTKKQADTYIDVTGIDKSSHAVRTMSEKEQRSYENPFISEEF